MTSYASDWLVPDWPAPPMVRAVCTTRGTAPAAGASRGAYAFFNVGDHVADDAGAVHRNRQALAHALGAQPVFVRQVHRAGVTVLGSARDGGVAADGVATRVPHLACTIMVADCLPVLFADVRGRCVGAAHAGWRGLSAGVLEATVMRLRALGRGAGATEDGWMAWLGPCIGPGEFEVGQDVVDAFVHQDGNAGRHFLPSRTSAGKWFADLAALARERLRAVGVASIYGNDSSPGWCTVRNRDRFYSHRRARREGHAATGRMAACIWLAPATH